MKKYSKLAVTLAISIMSFSTLNASPVSKEEVDFYANQITERIKGELGWSEIPIVVNYACKIIDSWKNFSIADRKTGIIAILDKVIDDTDTPFMPDDITDPLMKSMVSAIADLFLTKDVLDVLDFPIPKDFKNKANCESAADLICKRFDDGFQWSDLFYIIRVSIKFGLEVDSMTWREREDLMNNIIDIVIDRTDTPYLPDAFTDPIFKSFAHSLIKEFVEFLQK